VIGCKLYVFGLSRDTEDGSKDKQFSTFYKIYVPKTGRSIKIMQNNSNVIYLNQYITLPEENIFVFEHR
jgi:hypothetical protein